MNFTTWADRLPSAPVKLDEFDYPLPAERIAQRPAEPRDAARLCVCPRAGGELEHVLVRDLPRFLRAGDLLVTNDTRVLPARLCGVRPSGGQVELLLLGPALHTQPGAWRALVKPAARIRVGDALLLEQGALCATALERERRSDGSLAPEWIVRLESPSGQSGSVEDLLETHGRMPLPPYIHRPLGPDPEREADRERYQTIYARVRGAIAAPTAGLHFTPALLEAIEAAGVRRTSVTLHVGLGTFLPVSAAVVEEHRMHSERFEVSEGAARAVHETRARGGRVVAVGTTSVRALESACDALGRVVAHSGATEIFITPGYRFRAVDGLLTNFHLPRSTLLMLVSAFAGRERVLAAYAEALAREYRFFSYGDAMLLLDP
jgi:S-adenosylmethionine:tRNA ribosyltransferase-isomerase